MHGHGGTTWNLLTCRCGCGHVRYGVVDCAGSPGAKGNVVIGRAGRAFLDGSGITSEVFNMSKVCA